MSNEKESYDLYQIAILIDQLKSDDITSRINAHKSIARIATVLGPERTRKELIPYLTSCCDDEEDVVEITGNKIGELVTCIGGSEYSYLLLQPLETLLSSEASRVREAALLSLSLVIKSMPDNQLIESGLPFVERLSKNYWFPGRISATSAIPLVYDKMPSNVKVELEKIYLSLCKDETPIVRRNACLNLGLMCEKVNLLSIDAFTASLKVLSHDDQDSVRIQAFVPCMALSRVLSKEIVLRSIVPIIISLASDKSWRVRWSVSSGLDVVASTLGIESSTSNFAGLFENLLNDSEAEVRSIAITKLPLVAKWMRKDVVVGTFLPIIHRFINDQSEHVRSSLSSVINSMASLLSRSDCIEHLLPAILLLLRDESSEVRLNVISNLTPINDAIGVELLSQSLFPSILGLAEDSKWRVRQSIIAIIPSLAQQLGKEFFNEKLNEICLNWLVDSVYEIRRSTVEVIKKLSLHFGEDWTKEFIFPRLERMLVHTNYLHRITAIACLQALVDTMSLSSVDSFILPLLLPMSKDVVSNVRLVAARCLSYMCRVGKTNKSLCLKVTPILSQLMNDKDPDVRPLALEGLQILGN